jgi:hypothetical protein
LLKSLTLILGVTGASEIQKKGIFFCVKYGMGLELIAANLMQNMSRGGDAAGRQGSVHPEAYKICNFWSMLAN